MSAIKRLNIESVEAKLATANQSQTRDSFAFKWANREVNEGPGLHQHVSVWLFERYCGGDPKKLDEWLSKPNQIILEAGCGSGNSALLFFGDRLNRHDYLGIDISSAVNIAKERFAEKNIKGDFLQVGILDFLAPPNSIDMIFSEGVLHHTDDTRTSIIKLSGMLKKGGLFLFYVYQKKSVIREFNDDFIREKLKDLTDQEAWDALMPLTKFGISLGEQNLDINVPEDLDFFGIKAGNYNLQRFFYWHIFKLFFREDMSLDEMNNINFDWYRPLNCFRHTFEEIQQFCSEAGLAIRQHNLQESGITIVAEKI